MAAINLGEVLGSLENVVGSAGNLKGQVLSEKEKVAAEQARLETLRQQQEADAQAALKAKQDTEAAAFRAYNLDPTQADALMPQLSQEWNKLHTEQKALYEEIRKKQSSSFLSNPLQALYDALTIDNVIAQHNAVVDRKNSVSQNISAVGGMATTTAATNFAALKATDANLRQIEANDIAFKAQIQRYEAAKDFAKFNMNADQLVFSADTAVADARYKAFSAMQSAESMAMRRREEARQIKAWEEKEKTDIEWEQIRSDVSARYFNGAQLPMDWLKQMHNANTPEGQSMRWMVRSVITGSGIGTTPGEAILAADIMKISPANAGHAATAARLKTVATQVAKENEAQWQQMSPEMRARKIDAKLAKLYGDTDKVREAVVIDETSPYYAPPVQTLLSTLQDVDKSILWSSGALSNLPADKPLDHRQVLNAGMLLLQEGKYGPLNKAAIEKMTAEIAATYKEINRLNYEVAGLRVFNLPARKTHVVRTDEGFFSAAPSTVDLTDQTSLTRYYLTKITPPQQILRKNVFGAF